jgi:hypothetical protein
MSPAARLRCQSYREIAIRLMRSPSDAHHLRFAQPRAMGLKVSDEFTVPLCRAHHHDNHRFGDEQARWEATTHDPIAAAVDPKE